MRHHVTQTVLVIIWPVICIVPLLLFRANLEPQVYEVPFDYDPLPVINTTWSRPPDFEWTIAYSPKNAFLDSMMQDVMVTMNMTKVVPYANQKSLNRQLRNKTNRPLVGIIFDDSFTAETNKWPKDLKYRMRFPAELRTDKIINLTLSGVIANWNTQNLYPPFAEDDGPRNMNESDGGRPPGYYEEKFATVQSAVSIAFIKAHADNATDPVVSLQRFSYPPITLDLFGNMVNLVHWLIYFGFMFPFTHNVKVMILRGVNSPYNYYDSLYLMDYFSCR